MPHSIDTDDLDLARPGRRAAAGVLDLLVLGAAGALGWTWSAATAAVAAAAVLLAQAVALGRGGWTLGRAVTGLRTLDVETRAPIGLPRVLVRALVLAAGVLAAGVGLVVVLLSPLFDRTGRLRGWHDRAAGDEVFDVRRRASRQVLAAASAPPARSVGAHGPGGERGAVEAHAAVGREVGPAPSVQAPSVPTPAAPAWLAPSTSGTAQLEEWLESGAGQPTLVLAPIGPDRRGPDLDTRALPVVPPARPADRLREGVPARHAAEPVGSPVVPSPGPGHGYPDLDPETEMTRRAVPRDDLVGEVPADVALRPSSAQVALGDGRRITVERSALVGRNPTSDSDVQLVRVVDPGRSVSKTHLQIGVEPGGVWVADRGSTNGTVVTLPGGGQVVCGVDQQVRLRVGAVVRFGDCTLWLVREPGEPAGS